MEFSSNQLKAVVLATLIMALCIPNSEAKPIFGLGGGGGSTESALTSGIGSVLLTKILNSDFLGTAKILKDHPTLKSALGSAVASGLLTKILNRKAEEGGAKSGAWKAAIQSGLTSAVLSKVLNSGLLGKPSAGTSLAASGITGALLGKLTGG